MCFDLCLVGFLSLHVRPRFDRSGLPIVGRLHHDFMVGGVLSTWGRAMSQSTWGFKQNALA